MSPRVYVVAWPDDCIVKAGETSSRRWRTFVNRGAVLHQLTLFTDWRHSLHYETELHDYLRSLAPLAFTERAEATHYLGPSGGGWMETYRATNPAMLQALLQALPKPAPEHCLENPPEDYYQATPLDCSEQCTQRNATRLTHEDTGNLLSHRTLRAGATGPESIDHEGWAVRGWHIV